MDSPYLTITEQGQTRQIPRLDVTPTTPAALVRISPDQIVRETMESNSAALGAYLRTIAPTLHGQNDAGARSAPGQPAGLSTAPELQARNARYYVTVAALVAVLAALVAGLVQLATLADLVSESWQWPVWLTITGAAAFLTIRAIHESESRRTPEGIADTRAGADAYATEKDAESRHLIAAAFAAAIQTDATTKAQDADARHAATMQEVNRIASQPTPAPRHRQITLRQQPEDMQGMMTYATTTPAPVLQNAPARQEAQDAARAAYTPEYTDPPASAPPRPRHAAQTADPALVNMLQTVSDLFDDSATRADDLITIRLPWSARGQWPAETKRAAEQTLKRLDPPLIIAGAGNRYRLNRAAWCKGLALNAIRQNWRG